MRDPTDGGMSILSKETDLPPNNRSPRMDPFVKNTVKKIACIDEGVLQLLSGIPKMGMTSAQAMTGSKIIRKPRATVSRPGVIAPEKPMAAAKPAAPQVQAAPKVQTAVPQQAISPKPDVTVPQPKPSTPVQPKPLAPSPSASPIPAPDAAIAKTPPPNWPVDTTFAGQSLPPGAAVAKTPPPKVEPSPAPKTPPPPKPVQPEQKPAPPEQKQPPAGGPQQPPPPIDKPKTDQSPAGGQQPPAGGQGSLDPAERQRRFEAMASGETPKDLASYHEATKTQDPAMWKQMALQMGTFMLPQMAAGLLFPDHPMLGMVGAMASQPYLHQLGQKHLLRFDPQQQARAKAAWARGEQSTAFTAAEEARRKQQAAEAAAGAQTPLPQKAI